MISEALSKEVGHVIRKIARFIRNSANELDNNAVLVDLQIITIGDRMCDIVDKSSRVSRFANFLDRYLGKHRR
jgi:hypothetical protein